MQTSYRQQAVLDEFSSTDRNIIISACAGSGKTTTLIELLKICDKRTLFVAFNKAIQEDVTKKMESLGLVQGKALTLHSLGLSAIREHTSFNINKNKNWDIIKKLQTSTPRSVSKLFRDSSVIFCLIAINDISRMNLTDDIFEIENIYMEMGGIFPAGKNIEELWLMFIEVRESYYDRPILDIDFLDMVYLPTRLNLTIPVYPYYLFIDECQDLNLCQHELIKNLILNNTVKKWVAVGDRNQSIYGFAGAHSKSFDLFKNLPGEYVELPLDICYRSPKNIVDQANLVYDSMVPFKTENGIVGSLSDITKVKDSSMIICRNTAPLISVYFQLVGAGKSCYINGDDFIGQIIRFLKDYTQDTVLSARREMEYRLEKLCEDTSDKGEFKRYIFESNFEMFNEMSIHLCTDFTPIESLLQKLKSLFNRTENSIMLCTIHKSKGLEADVVYILNENLIPSKFSVTPEQKTQEQNLKYVARTRARKEMYYLNINLNKKVT